MWAVDSAAGTPTWLTLANFLAVLGALSPIMLLVLGKRLTTQVEESTSRRTDAEARKTDADAARQLIAEARQIMADKEALADAKIDRVKAESAAEIERVKVAAQRETNEAKMRITRLEDDFARMQRTLAVHIPWDVEAWARIKLMDPSFPEPPPIEHRAIESDYPPRPPA